MPSLLETGARGCLVRPREGERRTSRRVIIAECSEIADSEAGATACRIRDLPTQSRSASTPLRPAWTLQTACARNYRDAAQALASRGSPGARNRSSGAALADARLWANAIVRPRSRLRVRSWRSERAPGDACQLKAGVGNDGLEAATTLPGRTRSNGGGGHEPVTPVSGKEQRPPRDRLGDIPAVSPEPARWLVAFQRTSVGESDRVDRDCCK